MEKTNSVIIVDGEAPESSSDEEIGSFDIPITLAREVSESNCPSITTITTHNSQGNEFPSIYHNKLYRKNLDLWNHLSGLISRTIENVSKNLIATDQLLLKSQITLQSVSKSTKKVNTNMETVSHKINGLLTTDFLPALLKSPHS